MAPSTSLTALVACALTPLFSSPAMAFNPLGSIQHARHTQHQPPTRNSHCHFSQLRISSGRSSIDSIFDGDDNDDTSSAITESASTPAAATAARRRGILEDRKREWVDRSVRYYSTVMREEKRRNRGQIPPTSSPDERYQQIELAQRHYFALRKIKSGQLNHAERIYRDIIDDLMMDDDGCDHAKLAVSTLLLALLLQRMGDVKGTRSVFLNFFRIAVLESDDDGKECACSAKVLQAYALFEMKRGHGKKSLEIVERAVMLDEELKPVLAWKQFREVMSSSS